MSKSHRGFTLIELVVVIVILGILAAFAVPRFVRLDQQARIASVRALEGSLQSGTTMVNSLWRASGGPAFVTVEGARIDLVFGYPDRNDIDDTLAPGMLGNAPGRWAYNTTTGVFSLVGAATPAGCSITYTPPAAANGRPTIAVSNRLNQDC